MATENDAIEIDQNRVSIEGDAGSVRLVTTEEAIELFPAIYEVERSRRPGMLSRTELWWKHHFDDPKAGREGFSSLRCVLHETDGVPDGYAIYRQKSNWETGFPDGKISIRELDRAVGDRAHGPVALPDDDRSLPARSSTGIFRLTTRSRGRSRITGASSGNGGMRCTCGSSTSSRRSRPGRTRLTALCASPSMTRPSRTLADRSNSRWLGGVGTCRRVDDAVTDLSLGTTDLASLYLGGNSTSAMAQAGRIRGAEESIVLLGRMFRGDVAPWCEEVF